MVSRARNYGVSSLPGKCTLLSMDFSLVMAALGQVFLYIRVLAPHNVGLTFRRPLAVLCCAVCRLSVNMMMTSKVALFRHDLEIILPDQPERALKKQEFQSYL
jgi:hypothetical protein